VIDNPLIGLRKRLAFRVLLMIAWERGGLRWTGRLSQLLQVAK
jgi:hypothetical protein